MTPEPILRVVLTGFMGAGKSTVAALLAAELGWKAFDTDQLLVAREGASIAELFERAGEPAFRLLEEHIIAGLLGTAQAVIALGGGALESEITRSRLLAARSTYVVFLETPLAVALARCAGHADGPVRPVLRDRVALAARFQQRLEHYRIAHQTLPTEDHTPPELVHLLLKKIALRVVRTSASDQSVLHQASEHPNTQE